MGESEGVIMIAPEVLMTIARQAALNVPGVASMSPGIGGSFNRLLRRGKENEGVKVEVEAGVVSVDLFIVAQPRVNMLRLGQEIQKEVARAIQDLVAMPVREVNVHIQDIVLQEGGEEKLGEGSS